MFLPFSVIVRLDYFRFILLKSTYKLLNSMVHCLATGLLLLE